ncbi:DEKNAAC103732 [Brettanomyces naardenensis]|uniref:DEKNAAC103733 n=1 Tax=Brettanomyces naardenensis TaxID=13370 RepID=A0A448YP70_BRENA|nr:DEKNAAC103732 [Brettanomyces naardenensis]
MWKKKGLQQGYQHPIGESTSNDFVFSSEEGSSNDLLQGDITDTLPGTKPSFFRSFTSLSRKSHEYTGGNNSRRSLSRTRSSVRDSPDGTNVVIGAGFSHVDRVFPDNSWSRSPETAGHGEHHKSRTHKAKEDEGLGDDSDWNADLDDIVSGVPRVPKVPKVLKGDTPQPSPEPKKEIQKTAKDIQYYPSLEGLSLEDNTPEQSTHQHTTKPHRSPADDSTFPLLRPDYQQVLENPFSVLTRQQPPPKDAVRYRKVVKALTRQPFDMEELKKQTWGGIPLCLRGLVWPILVGYLPVNTGTRESVLSRKRKEYVKSIRQLFQGEKEQVLWHQIEIDVPRTNPGIPLYAYASTHRSLERILYLWAIRHPASGYVQGINDLVTPFFQVFLANYLKDESSVINFDPKDTPKEVLNSVEADTYWCLTKVLDTIQDNFIHEQPGIIRQIKELQDLVTRDEPMLAEHFRNEHLDFIQFAFRWMNCLLMREFDLSLVIRIWDTYLSDFPNGFSRFHVYVCCAFLRRFSDELLGMEFQDIIMFLQSSEKTKNWTEEDIEMMLSEAYVWESLYENATAHLK